MTDRDRRQYLEECGSACPACRSFDAIARSFDGSGLSTPPDARPTLRVRCACRSCGALWWESWRLHDVEAPEPPVSLVEAFAALRRAGGDAWDGVDVEGFMREMRGDGP